MAREPKRIRVVNDEPVSAEELRKAKNFGKLRSRYNDARKPLYERSLFHYRQRWFFIGIILFVIIILLIMNVL